MGCDIHGFVEYQQVRRSRSRSFQWAEWVHFGAFWIKRNYVLFNYLAGVRGGPPPREPGPGEPPMFPARGVPFDMDYSIDEGPKPSW